MATPAAKTFLIVYDIWINICWLA